jgi:hypothetical protein
MLNAMRSVGRKMVELMGENEIDVLMASFCILRGDYFLCAASLSIVEATGNGGALQSEIVTSGDLTKDLKLEVFVRFET